MKIVRLALVLLLAATATACSGDATGPRADECPTLGSGSGTCS